MHFDNNYFWIGNNNNPCKTNIQKIEYRKEFQLKHEMRLGKNVFNENQQQNPLYYKHRHRHRTRPKPACSRQGYEWLEYSLSSHFFVIHGGSPLTFRTQLEKVLIFRHTFSWFMGGPNWTFRCLDCTQLCIWIGQTTHFCFAKTSPLYDRHSVEEFKTKENRDTYLSFRNPFIKFLKLWSL